MEKELEAPQNGRRRAPRLLRARLPGGPRSATTRVLLLLPKPPAICRIFALLVSLSRSLLFQRGYGLVTGLLRWGAAALGLPKQSPRRLPKQTGRRSLAVVCAVFGKRTRPPLGLGALETKQKEKGKKPGYRLAPHRRLNPRCTPFFGGKGGGRGRRGAGGCRRGSGEGNYLRFNCRWRLRLFQDR